MDIDQMQDNRLGRDDADPEAEELAASMRRGLEAAHPPKPVPEPARPRPLAPVVARALWLAGVLAGLAALLYGASRLLGPEEARVLIVLAIGAVGATACLWLGGHMEHRRQLGQPPLPTFMFDPAKMANWIRTGRAEGNPADEPPPIEDEQENRPRFRF